MNQSSSKAVLPNELLVGTCSNSMCDVAGLSDGAGEHQPEDLEQHAGGTRLEHGLHVATRQQFYTWPQKVMGWKNGGVDCDKGIAK